jgi:hypothetical protein
MADLFENIPSPNLVFFFSSVAPRQYQLRHSDNKHVLCEAISGGRKIFIGQYKQNSSCVLFFGTIVKRRYDRLSA